MSGGCGVATSSTRARGLSNPSRRSCPTPRATASPWEGPGRAERSTWTAHCGACWATAAPPRAATGTDTRGPTRPMPSLSRCSLATASSRDGSRGLPAPRRGALALLALLLSGTTVSAQTNFQTYVAVGDSLTAGFSSASLVVTHQSGSYPARLARQAGVAGFQQPTVSDPGIPPELALVSL